MVKITPRTDTTTIKLMPTRVWLSPTRATAELPDAPPDVEGFPELVPLLLPEVGAADGVKTALGLAMQELAAALADAPAALFTVPLPEKLHAVAVFPLSS